MMKAHLAFAFILLSMALLLGTGCSSSQASEDAISTLENRYQELLNQPGNEVQVEQVWASMRELAAAYEERSQSDIPVDEAVNDLYRAAELYGGADQYPKALEIFDQIIGRFPAHKRAADALFQKGFIFNNHLKDTASARVAYTAFIQQYPDDPLADDAQMEIERLGIPTEEWFDRFINQKDSTAEKNID